MKLDKNFLALLDELYEGVYIVDLNRKIIFWNKAAEDITGYKVKEVLGKSCQDNILKHIDKNGKELCLDICPLSYVMKNNKISSEEVYLHHKSGYRLLVKIKGFPILEEGKDIKGAIEIFIPVISGSDEDKDLFNLALKDALTKVYNRKGFEFLFPIRQREMDLFKLHTGVLFFDIDDFKQINDTYGHEAGDKILYAVAQIFVKSLRYEDIIIRWGGEEFVLVIFVKERSKLNLIGNKLTKLVESTFIDYDQNIIRFTVSGGGTFLKDNEDISGAIKRADELMFKAKSEGKNRFISDADIF